ncbi:dioxygenase family protein [Hutsoniella sourekii]
MNKEIKKASNLEAYQYIVENGKDMDREEFKSYFPLFEPGPGPALANLYGKNDDMTTNSAKGGEEAIGQRIVISGRVLDEEGEPVPNAFIEIWQANAAGRYIHKLEYWDAPLDPNFVGSGWTHTDDQGRYSFTTIKPGNYCFRPENNHWRPAHIHLSVMGPKFIDRLVTQLYFEGDPLLPYDSTVYQKLSEEEQKRVIATYNHDKTLPDWALGFDFDIVLRGSQSLPVMPNKHELTDEDLAEIERMQEEKYGKNK